MRYVLLICRCLEVLVEMSLFRKLMVLVENVQRLKEESGQDLVEYALVVALVAFAATAGMSTLASGLNSAFSAIGATLGTYIS